MKIKNIYDLTEKFKGERPEPKPFSKRELRQLNPYALSLRQRRRLEATAKLKRYGR